MSAYTITAGYPVHRVVAFRRWMNPNRVRFTDWTAACGATGTLGGHALGAAGSALRNELCVECFPGRQHRGNYPDPVDKTNAEFAR